MGISFNYTPEGYRQAKKEIQEVFEASRGEIRVGFERDGKTGKEELEKTLKALSIAIKKRKRNGFFLQIIDGVVRTLCYMGLAGLTIWWLFSPGSPLATVLMGYTFIAGTFVLPLGCMFRLGRRILDYIVVSMVVASMVLQLDFQVEMEDAMDIENEATALMAADSFELHFKEKN